VWGFLRQVTGIAIGAGKSGYTVSERLSGGKSEMQSGVPQITSVLKRTDLSGHHCGIKFVCKFGSNGSSWLSFLRHFCHSSS